jgi:hypothetical protein
MYYIVAQPIVLCVYCCTKDQNKSKEENCPEMGIALVVGTCVCASPCVCGFLCAQAEPLFKNKNTPQIPQATMGGVANPVAVGQQPPMGMVATAVRYYLHHQPLAIHRCHVPYTHRQQGDLWSKLTRRNFASAADETIISHSDGSAYLLVVLAGSYAAARHGDCHRDANAASGGDCHRDANAAASSRNGDCHAYGAASSRNGDCHAYGAASGRNGDCHAYGTTSYRDGDRNTNAVNRRSGGKATADQA